jgi:hypothetical protein
MQLVRKPGAASTVMMLARRESNSGKRQKDGGRRRDGRVLFRRRALHQSAKEYAPGAVSPAAHASTSAVAKLSRST